ncbi:MAG: thioredoxin-dependent thiol peroxidase [Acidimicrobiia bacterium]|nr:thioredoxin-dependent thiol peroxidase [Acidimicrobiia bacterium]
MRLQPGDQAPGFELPDSTDTPRTLADFGGQSVILFFYPKAFTPGCVGESCDFRDRSEPLAAAGYAVVGVSPDPVDVLARFRTEYQLDYPLLSDVDHAVAGAFGAWGTKKNYGKEYEGLIRSTVVVGPDGLVEAAWYNVRAKGHANRVLEALASADQ